MIPPAFATDPMVALVLAAGGSTRMGAAKPLLRWGDTHLLGHTLRTVRTAGCTRAVVVVGRHADAVVAAIPSIDGIEVVPVRNSDWSSGQRESLRVGFAAVERGPRPGRLLIALIDQPLIPASHHASLIEGVGPDCGVVATDYDGRGGVPLAIDGRHLRSAADAVTSGRLRDFVNDQASRTDRIDCEAAKHDLDTPRQYEWAMAKARANLRPEVRLPHGAVRSVPPVRGSSMAVDHRVSRTGEP